MTDSEKQKIIALWSNGMPMARIRQMVAVPAREFHAIVKEMRANGEFPTEYKTTEQKVVEAFHRGERNPYKIAEEVGVTEQTVRQYLYQNGLRRGKKTRNWFHSERTNAIAEDLKEGALSQVEIARKHQVTKQYVNKIKGKLRLWEDEPNKFF